MCVLSSMVTHNVDAAAAAFWAGIGTHDQPL